MIGLPLFNNVLLASIHNVIYGDIMYKTFADVLEITISILSMVTFYLSLGMLINTLLRKNLPRNPSFLIIILYIISIIIVYISDFIFAKNLIAFTIFLILALAGDILIFISTLFVCNKTVRRYKITRPEKLSLNGKLISLKIPVLKTIFIMTIVIFAFNFVSNTVETIILITDYGFPSNTTEILYLLEPYLSFIIYAVAGYLTMLVTSVFWYHSVIPSLKTDISR